MTTLRITIEWPHGEYHGREWPPSPWRLYQAMRAGAAALQRSSAALEAALRHFERLAPPVITAPATIESQPLTAAVANNDGDRVLALYAKGEPAAARRLRARAVTLRTRRVRRFEGVVAYDFDAEPETAGHAAALAVIAGDVSAVGHGVDLALARATLTARAEAVGGVRYVPARTGRRTFAVPWPGAFDALERRHRTESRRIDGDVIAPQWEAAAREVAYRCELDLPPVRFAAFVLHRPDNTPLAIEGTRAMAVAAMVRHAIDGAARRAGLAQATRAALMGHGADETRIRVQPLPNVGIRFADGCIRRVMLSAADGVDEADWSDVTTRLLAAPLVPEGARAPIAMLAPPASRDPVVARFRGVARRWTTATPVVVPGHDHRRGKPRPRRTVERLLRHAGVAPAWVESVAMEPAPRVRGCASASRYRRPAHLAHFPCRHMSVWWTVPIAGPLALGAGAGYGLGLFVPVPD